MKSHYCGPFTWTLIRVLQRLGLLRHLNFKVSARIGGHTVIVPLREGIGTNLLLHDEPWMHPLLDKLLRHFPGVFIDVGVNVCQTLCKVKAIAPEVEYLGFEPNPVCIHYAQEIVLLQRYKDARIVPAGLSDHDGLLPLELHTATMADTAATIVPDFRPGFTVFRKLVVPVVRFETAARDLGIGAVGIVKIDVEGGEREVLLGLEERLQKDRPAVVLEILPVGTQPKRLPRQQDVEALFARTGYRLHNIVKQPPSTRPHDNGSFEVLPMSDPIGVHNDQTRSNYLALPIERHDVLPELRGLFTVQA